jgi:hypothetical protein
VTTSSAIGPLGRLTGTILAAALLTACSGAGTTTVADAGDSAPLPANAVPDDTVAVTDAPRPSETDVVITLAAWDQTGASLHVAGYVSPVVEEGGTCTVELARDGESVETAGPAVADATTTICGDLAIDRDRLSAGVWTAVLRYASPTTSAVSEPIIVEVSS